MGAISRVDIPPPPPPPKNQFLQAIENAQRTSEQAASSGNAEQSANAQEQWSRVFSLAQDNYRRAAIAAPDSAGVPAAIQETRTGLEDDFEASGADPADYTQLLDAAEETVLAETPDQRESRVALSDAQEGLTAAGSEWETAQGWSESQRGNNPELQARYDAAEQAYTQAEQNVATATNAVVDADLDAKLHALYGEGENGTYTQEQVDAAAAAVNETYGGTEETARLIEFRAAVLTEGSEARSWLDRIQTNPNDLNLTAAERELAQRDPVTLAFLKSADVTLELDPAKDPSLSQEEIALGESNPVLFAFMQTQDIRITTNGGAPQVTINGEEQTLTQEQRDAFAQGGTAALAMSLSQPVYENPEMAALIEVSDDLRTEYATSELGRRSGDDALAFVNTQLEGFFNPEARAAFWNETALPVIRPHLESGVEGVTAEDNFESAYLTILGQHMDGVLENASPEVANLLLDIVKERVETYLPEAQFASSQHFMGSLATAVHIADQDPTRNRAEEFGRWLVEARGGMLMDINTGNEMGQNIRETGHYELAEATLNEIRKQDGYIDGFDEEFASHIEQGKEAARNKIAENQRNEAYEAFMDPEFHLDTVNGYFNSFLGAENVGSPISTQNSPQLRNAIGRAMNLQGAEAPDAGGDLYAEGTRERAIIDLIVSWIDQEDGDGARVEAVPIIYASERDGVEYGALFRITKEDGSKVVIDGSMAEDAFLTAASEDGRDLSDPEAVYGEVPTPDEVMVDWRYSSLDDFVDENPYDTDGKIYMPENWSVADGDNDGNVEWREMDAARKTTGEWVKEGIDIAALVAGTVAGFALAPVTAGGSLAMTAVVWGTVGASVGWQVWRGHDMRSQMAENGQSTDWSNPNVQATWTQQGAALFGLVPMFASARAISLSRSGGFTLATGQAARNASLTAQGQAAIDRGMRYANIARHTGRVNAIVGVHFMATHAHAMLTNWDRMSTSERILNAFYFGFGVSQFGVGAAAARIPALSRRLAGNSGLRPEEEQYLSAIHAAREASDTNTPLDPAIGQYAQMANGTVAFVPTHGDPITIHPAEAPTAAQRFAAQQARIQERFETLRSEAGPDESSISLWLQARQDVRTSDRAYEIWNQAGRPDGQADAHWAQAEQELAATAPVNMRYTRFDPQSGEYVHIDTNRPAGDRIVPIPSRAEANPQQPDQVNAPPRQPISMRYTRRDPQSGEEVVIDTSRPAGDRIVPISNRQDENGAQHPDQGNAPVQSTEGTVDRTSYAGQQARIQQRFDVLMSQAGPDDSSISLWLQARREVRIADRAHELWNQAGRPEGGEVAYRTRAEQEIAAEAPVGMRYVRFDRTSQQYVSINTNRSVGDRVEPVESPYSGSGLNQRVRRRAAEIWENEGRPDGRADEHWAQAEREIATEDGLVIGRPVSLSGDPVYNAARTTAVETRAHQIWEEAGRPEGEDLAHWTQAEEEVDAAIWLVGDDTRLPVDDLGGALWFNERSNRLYVDETDPVSGETISRPHDPGLRAAFYSQERNETYVLDPDTGRLQLFGPGDNRRTRPTDLLPDGRVATQDDPPLALVLEPQTGGGHRSTSAPLSELVFYNPWSERTFTIDPTEGVIIHRKEGEPDASGPPRPALQETPPFADGARVYNSQYNKEYLYSAERQRFEPLDPGSRGTYYHADSNQTFIRTDDGGLEFFGVGDYRRTTNEPVGLPAPATREAPKGAQWIYWSDQNRTYTVDPQTGRFRPLDSGDRITHYDAKNNTTYLIDLQSGQSIFFGRGDNRHGEFTLLPETPDHTPPAWQKKAPDLRASGTLRLRIPTGVASFFPWSSPTAASFGFGMGTKSNPSIIRTALAESRRDRSLRPLLAAVSEQGQVSVRLHEWRNTTMAAWKTWFVSKQTAFQLKASTMFKPITAALTRSEKDPAFVFELRSVELVGDHAHGPNPVVELQIRTQLNAKSIRLEEGQTDMFGVNSSEGYELIGGIPFNKVQTELKVGIPRLLRNIIEEQTRPAQSPPPQGRARPGEGDEPEGYNTPLVGMEIRPEIALPGGIPKGMAVPKEFYDQAQAALSRLDIRLQVVARDADVVNALMSEPSLARLQDMIANGRISLDESVFFLPASGGGTRLSAVPGKSAYETITDLTGRQRTVWAAAQSNLEVMFNDRFSTRGFDRLPNVDRLLTAIPGVRRVVSVSEPNRLRLNGSIWRIFTEAEGGSAPTRVTVLGSTPVLLVVSGEGRIAFKSSPKQKAPSDVAAPTYAVFEAPDAQGGTTARPIPLWFAERLARARTGEGIVMPRGGQEALEIQFLRNLETEAATPAQRAAVADFRNNILPKLTEGDFWSPEMVTKMTEFMDVYSGVQEA